MSRLPFRWRKTKVPPLSQLVSSNRTLRQSKQATRHYSVLPSTPKSSAMTTQPASTTSSNFWRSVLMELLTGENVSAVRGGAWTESGLLHAASVRSEPWHPLHRCNLPLLPLLVKLFHAREPFQDSELELLRRRADHPSLLEASGEHEEQDVAKERVEAIPIAADTIHDLLHRLTTEQPSAWVEVTEKLFQCCKRNSSSIYDDVLFRISSNACFFESSSMVQCFGEVLKIVGTCFLPHARQTVMSSPPHQSHLRCVVSPRWMRKVRKHCCESQSYGSIMHFASFYESLVALEEKGIGKTELTCDGELLAFHSSIAGRRDSGLSRDAIAQETISQLTFCFPRLLSLSSTPGSTDDGENVTDVTQRALRNSFNSIAFAKNDGNEATRLRDAIVRNILPSLLPPRLGSNLTSNTNVTSDKITLNADMVTLLFEIAFDALKGKWEALRCTCSAALAGFLKSQVALLNYLELQQLNENTDSLVSLEEVGLCVENTDAELLRATSATTQRVMDTTAMLLSSMGGLVTTPRLFDSLSQSFTDILEAVLAPFRLHTRHICSLVCTVAKGAPHGSIWKQWAKSPLWICGCGQENFFVASACVSCTLIAPTSLTAGAKGGISCPQCKTRYSAHLPACVKCASPQPRLRALDNLSVWICHTCETQNSNTKSSCIACNALNPRRRTPCPSCNFECVISDTRCLKCGESLSPGCEAQQRRTTASATERLWICSTCHSLLPVGRPSGETLPCRHCAAQGTQSHFVDKSSVTTRFFQWTCGCGARNHPSNIQCHKCTCIFTCTSCKSPVDTLKPSKAPQALTVPSLGTDFSPTICGSCRSLHPRDKTLFQVRRATLCNECESINSLESEKCYKCDAAVRDNRLCRTTAVVDLPWTCHCCGQVNVLEDDQQSDGFASCTSCLVDRPPGVLFDQHLPWNCSHCGMNGAVGFHCPRCFNLHPAVPPNEADLWECSGCSATNFSWSKLCAKCQSARGRQSSIHPYQPWTCGRCNSFNSPLVTEKCGKCHLRKRHAFRRAVSDGPSSSEERLQAVEALLMAAASDGAASWAHNSNSEEDTITSLLMNSSLLSESMLESASTPSSIDAVLNDLMMR